MTIGDRISMLRRSRDLSQEELAEMCGVSRQAVSKWESEQSMPEIDKIITLSDIFAVTTDYILRGIEPLSERPDRKNFPAKPFNIIATVIMMIGFVISLMFSVGQFYNKDNLFYVTLFMYIAACISLMIFALGSVRIPRREQKVNAMRFARINVWIVAFVILSVIFNGICCKMAAPVPLPMFGTPYNDDDYIVRDSSGNVYDNNGNFLYNINDNQHINDNQRPAAPYSLVRERRSYYEENWTDSQRNLQAAVFVIAYMLICTGTTVVCTVKIERNRKGLLAAEKKEKEEKHKEG